MTRGIRQQGDRSTPIYNVVVELLARLASIFGFLASTANMAQDWLRSSRDIRFAKTPGILHCGVCFGCLVRRAAFHRAGIADLTAYLIEDLTTEIGAYDGWYSEKRRRDLQAVRYAAARGVDPSDVTLNLPSDADAQAAIGVARRGLDELAALVL